MHLDQAGLHLQPSGGPGSPPGHTASRPPPSQPHPPALWGPAPRDCGRGSPGPARVPPGDPRPPSFLARTDALPADGEEGSSPGNGSERRGGLTRPGWRGCLRRELKMNTRGLGSQLKDSIPVTELSASGPFESHDLLRKGFSSVKNELLPSHPLELSEKNFQLNQDKMNFSTLRNIQGLFAPLKLQMEFKAVQQVQRLPFLPSSNLSLDILRGNDETIGFEDILNDPSQSELMGEPHLMVEYKLGLL
ncbi:proteasome maturation protein [Eptesicus fuscus]|uniref:proteasome maturation protein n=2 Tax=Boreoeutheria TaxID=1437010 RepID=UPI0024042283|nr:proteasome maturation protein [Eptesicus fuscus]